MNNKIWGREGQVLVVAIIITLTWGCNTGSLPNERFNESRNLPAPVVSATLADPDKFSFAVVGDLHVGSGDTSRLRRILTQAAAGGDAFFIALGDIVDGGLLSDIQAVKTALADHGFASNVLPVIGNHDIFHAGWTSYRDQFGPSHYVTTVGNTRFIALDTADGILDKSEEAWLINQIKQPGARRTFLLSHYLPIIPGQRTYLKLSNEEQAARLMKLATVHGVKAWLGAHYHSYIVEKIEGVDYVVAGGGGQRRMPPVSEHFFVRVNVDGDNVTYQMKAVE